MSNETIKNYGKSIRNKLLNISKKEDVFHQTILTRFFQLHTTLSVYKRFLPPKKRERELGLLGQGTV